jgi:hypothetical protein
VSNIISILNTTLFWSFGTRCIVSYQTQPLSHTFSLSLLYNLLCAFTVLHHVLSLGAFLSASSFFSTNCTFGETLSQQSPHPPWDSSHLC